MKHRTWCDSLVFARLPCSCDAVERQRLDNLSNALVADIMALSDEEVVTEFIEDGGDPEQHAAEMRALVEKVVKEHPDAR